MCCYEVECCNCTDRSVRVCVCVCTDCFLCVLLSCAVPCCAVLCVRTDALNNAITCTILAAAGPQRSRMLATLYKDERSAKLPVWPFLEKVYLERILRK